MSKLFQLPVEGGVCRGTSSILAILSFAPGKAFITLSHKSVWTSFATAAVTVFCSSGCNSSFCNKKDARSNSPKETPVANSFSSTVRCACNSVSSSCKSTSSSSGSGSGLPACHLLHRIPGRVPRSEFHGQM